VTVTFPGAAGTALPVGRPSLPTIMPAPWLLACQDPELLLGR